MLGRVIEEVQKDLREKKSTCRVNKLSRRTFIRHRRSFVRDPRRQVLIRLVPVFISITWSIDWLADSEQKGSSRSSDAVRHRASLGLPALLSPGARNFNVVNWSRLGVLVDLSHWSAKQCGDLWCDFVRQPPAFDVGKLIPGVA